MYLVAKVTDVVDPAVAGGVDLDDIEMLILGILESIHGVRDDTGNARLADSAWACQEVRVRDLAILDGVFEQIGDVRLTDNFIKRP